MPRLRLVAEALLLARLAGRNCARGCGAAAAVKLKPLVCAVGKGEGCVHRPVCVHAGHQPDENPTAAYIATAPEMSMVMRCAVRNIANVNPVYAVAAHKELQDLSAAPA